MFPHHQKVYGTPQAQEWIRELAGTRGSCCFKTASHLHTHLHAHSRCQVLGMLVLPAWSLLLSINEMPGTQRPAPTARIPTSVHQEHKVRSKIQTPQAVGGWQPGDEAEHSQDPVDRAGWQHSANYRAVS